MPELYGGFKTGVCGSRQPCGRAIQSSRARAHASGRLWRSARRRQRVTPHGRRELLPEGLRQRLHRRQPLAASPAGARVAGWVVPAAMSRVLAHAPRGGPCAMTRRVISRPARASPRSTQGAEAGRAPCARTLVQRRDADAISVRRRTCEVVYYRVARPSTEQRPTGSCAVLRRAPHRHRRQLLTYG